METHGKPFRESVVGAVVIEGGSKALGRRLSSWVLLPPSPWQAPHSIIMTLLIHQAKLSWPCPFPWLLAPYWHTHKQEAQG